MLLRHKVGTHITPTETRFLTCINFSRTTFALRCHDLCSLSVLSPFSFLCNSSNIKPLLSLSQTLKNADFLSLRNDPSLHQTHHHRLLKTSATFDNLHLPSNPLHYWLLYSTSSLPFTRYTPTSKSPNCPPLPKDFPLFVIQLHSLFLPPRPHSPSSPRRN